MTATGRRGVHARAVGVFLLVSFGAALLLDCVVAATGGLGTPQAKVILTLRMFTPALAAWVVCRFITRESWLRASGLARRRPVPGGVSVGSGSSVSRRPGSASWWPRSPCC